MRTVLLLSILGVALAAPAAAQERGYRVIVHPANPASRLPRARVSQMFLKKVKVWPDGGPVKPVQPPSESRTHRVFCEAIHGKSAEAVRSYWNNLIFSGRDVPPVEKQSDEEVVAFVRATAGAVGVVSSGTPLVGVKALEVD